MSLLFRSVVVFLILVGAVLQGQTPAPDLAVNPPPEVGPLNPALPSLFIAGDSTAAKAKGDPQQGWGVPFADYFDASRINIVNLARGGRSSRTFITEGLWEKLLGQLKAGDFVLIQFGHNDGGAINEEPPGSTRPLRARGTLPGIGEASQAIDNVLTKQPEVVHTYGWYVRKMITDVRARGAQPILVSLTLRNLWKDGKIERGSGLYRDWVRALAVETKTPWVDLSRLLADIYQERGPDAVKAWFGQDHTHTNGAGADLNASQVVSGLKGLKGFSWDEYLSEKGRAVAADSIGWLDLPDRRDFSKPAVVLIGDSTVRNGRGDGQGGQWGWGDFLAPVLGRPDFQVINRAVGGLSSRTFLTQGHWARAKHLLREGDWLIVQFGHNDSSPINDDKRARGTRPGVDDTSETIQNLLTRQEETVFTYGAYLRTYVREVRALGVKVVLCSPVPRKKWSEGKIVGTADTYAGWARLVAAQEGVPFIDLDAAVGRRYEQSGPAIVEGFFADEHTHTNEAGARVNAEIVAVALRAHLPAP